LREQVRNRLLHLITGKAAGDENPLEEFIGIVLRAPGEIDNRMHVEPVAAVCHGDAHAVTESGRGDRVGKVKRGIFAVKEVELSRGPGKALGEGGIRLRCSVAWFRWGEGCHADLLSVLKEQIRQICRIVKGENDKNVVKEGEVRSEKSEVGVVRGQRSKEMNQ